SLRCSSQPAPPTAFAFLSLHDALPISLPWLALAILGGGVACTEWAGSELGGPKLSIVPLIGIGSGTVLLDDLDRLHVVVVPISRDRKSTRLNSSHVSTSYAPFSLKKKF